MPCCAVLCCAVLCWQVDEDGSEHDRFYSNPAMGGARVPQWVVDGQVCPPHTLKPWPAHAHPILFCPRAPHPATSLTSALELLAAPLLPFPSGERAHAPLAGEKSPLQLWSSGKLCSKPSLPSCHVPQGQEQLLVSVMLEAGEAGQGQQGQQGQQQLGAGAAAEGEELPVGELLLLPMAALEEAYEMGGSVLSTGLVRQLSTRVRGRRKGLAWGQHAQHAEQACTCSLAYLCRG